MTSHLLHRTLLAGAATFAFAAPAVIAMWASNEPSLSNEARPCYNGVTRLNPYGTSCTIPGPTNKIRGSAPDANAIIACRNIPGCLSWYVNNP